MNAATPNLLEGAGGLFGLFLTLILLALLWVALLSLTRDLWRIVFLYETRRAPTLGFGSAIAIGVYILAGITLGAKHYVAMMSPVAALGPWLVVKSGSLYAWWRDGPEVRQAAMEIRSVEAARMRETLPRIDQKLPWRGYLFDVERAVRRGRYEPPPI